MEENENKINLIKLLKAKSNFIFNTIFSFVYYKKKLNIVKYNKYWHIRLGLNLEDFKLISGRYIQGGRDGKGKEYLLDSNILIYEGEYLNCLRNGKGKEYINNGYKSILKYEGEYLYGLRNGKGKEYSCYEDENFLIFDGEYLKGKKWNGKKYDFLGNLEYELINGVGIGKEYYYNDNIRFEGEYLNGLKNGKGKEYNKYGDLLYDGEYLNGLRNGNGKEYNYAGNLIFEGKYLNGKRI